MWVQFHPDRCTGRSRPNDKDFVFVISKMYHIIPVIYNGFPCCRWQCKCLSSTSRCCCETFRSKKWQEFCYHAYRLKENVFQQKDVTEGKYLQRGAFWDINPPDINNPKWGNPEPPKFWFLKIHFIHPIWRRKFAEFTGEIFFFKSDQKWQSVARKLSACVAVFIGLIPDSTNCFCGMAVSHWRWSSVQPCSHFSYDVKAISVGFQSTFVDL